VGPGLELTRRARTAHGEIAWDRLGDGPPVVLVHGTPSRALVWRHVARSLAAAGRSVFVYDLLGFGDSERGVEQRVDLEVHGQVLAELVGAWGLDRPALVGHDIGGAVVLRAHLLEGVAVSRIALVDAVVLAPWITDRTRAMQRRVDELRAGLPSDELARAIRSHLESATHRRLDPEVFASLFGQWEGAEGQALYLRNLAQFDEDHTRAFESRLAEIDVPVLVLWGEHDAWLPVEVSERVAAAIPGAARVVVAEAGHFAMEDQPDRIASELARFLA
jgi:pimeloyl-ACP methyl ester carboxylesterase